MILGLGVDIVEVSRVDEAIQRYGERFLRRVFTPLEIDYCRGHRNAAERFAARFAAKEATMKALGTGWRRGIRWREIEVTNARSGKPQLHLAGKAQEMFYAVGGDQAHLSLSHTAAYALAQVVIEGESSTD